MKPIRHPSNTRTLAAPEGWDEDLKVESLGITDQILEGVPCVWSFWRPDAQELAALNAGGAVVLSVVGRTMPPALLMVEAAKVQGEQASTVQAKIIEALNATAEDGPVSKALAEALNLLDAEAWQPGPVTQQWVHGISMMQQSVLLSAIRGPDGLAKYGGGAKMLLRWYRRCVLLSAMDGKVLNNPIDENGGSFTGPSLTGVDEVDHWTERMQEHVHDYLRQVDALPHHYQMHFMHAVEILGYKHPDPVIRHFWHQLYLRLVNDFHLWPETEEQLDERLGDTRSGWLKRADPATVA